MLLLNFNFGGFCAEDAPEEEAPEADPRKEAQKATQLIDSLRKGSFPEELSNIYLHPDAVGG